MNIFTKLIDFVSTLTILVEVILKFTAYEFSVKQFYKNNNKGIQYCFNALYQILFKLKRLVNIWDNLKSVLKPPKTTEH